MTKQLVKSDTKKTRTAPKKTKAAAKTKSASRKSIPPASVAQAAPVAQSPVRKIVHAACKRGKDPATANQSCNSLQAYQTSKPGLMYVSFQCVKCSHSWSITVGGSFNQF
jgi:hypothetical protein